MNWFKNSGKSSSVLREVFVDPKWEQGQFSWRIQDIRLIIIVSWSKPSISYEAGGHLAVRTEEWRYILYQNGSEELYDHRIGPDGHVADPNEWTNLAADPEYKAIKARMRALLPKIEPGCPTTRPTEKDRSED